MSPPLCVFSIPSLLFVTANLVKVLYNDVYRSFFVVLMSYITEFGRNDHYDVVAANKQKSGTAKC